MKNINKYILAILLTTLTIGCNDELDKKPYSELSKESSFENIMDASYWVNGMYNILRGNVYGIYTFATDLQADQLNATIEYKGHFKDLHTWSNLTPENETIERVWSGYYRGIANINVALDGFNKIEVKTNEEKETLNQFRGELYAARAFYFSELVRKYCKAYTPTSANTDLGIPVLLAYDISALPKRSTLEESYAQIYSDIENAKRLLANTQGKPMANKINIDFVNALEARVSLYNQKWEKAKLAAEKVINSGKYSLANGSKELIKLWKDDSSNEIIFQSLVQAPDQLTNANSIYLNYIPDYGLYQPWYIPSQEIIDLYDDKDARKSIYFIEDSCAFKREKHKATLVNKYSGNPDYFLSINSNYQQAPKIFRLAEMYLIAAEASYKMNDFGSAKSNLNTLRASRGLSATDDSAAALYEDIKDERTRELAFEGFRLDDLKRWEEKIERQTPQSLNYIMLSPENQFYQLKKPANNDRSVWPIPSSDTGINSNIKQNPGY